MAINDPNFAFLACKPTAAYGTVAAWAVGASQVAGALAYSCDATDEAAHLFIPLDAISHLPNRIGNAAKGFELESIQLDFEIRTAALDAMSAVINKVKRGADGSAAVVSTPAFTYDAGHDSAAERVDVDQHRMTLTLTTPVFIEDDEFYVIDLTIDKAATSLFDFLGAFAYGRLKA
jgi:hypothetical protein